MMDKIYAPGANQVNIDRIAEFFPNVVTETVEGQGPNALVRRAINFDLLRQELSDHIVEGPQERYQLDWPGKRAAAFAANSPIAKTLRPDREVSVDFDATNNLFIEGDNLDALKLLQESYLGRVKLIYIDPPYNTGSDLIYDDDFRVSNRTEQIRAGVVSPDGERLRSTDRAGLRPNPESNGRFHSDWLSMMYPRLKLARNFLRSDGVIAVSVDDHEVAGLLHILGELLGRENMIGLLPRLTKRAGKSGNLIAANHDYLLIWARSDNVQLHREEHSDTGFRYEDEFLAERGRYKLNQTLDYGSIQYSASLDYEIEIEGAIVRPGNATAEEMTARQLRNPKTGWCWRWSRDLFEFGFSNGFVVLKEGRDGKRIYTKTYERATIERSPTGYRVVSQNRTKAITSLDLLESKFSNDMASKGIKSLMGYAAFDYTKPVELVRTLIDWVTTPDGSDVVLDFFAGSGTAAQAVFEANADDGGDRRFVLVQLDEAVPKASEAASRGIATIAELARARIRLAGDRQRSKLEAVSADLGFRSFKVAPANLRNVSVAPDAIDQGLIEQFIDTVAENTPSEALLFEVMLKEGLSPDLDVEVRRLAGCETFLVAGAALVACFEPELPDELFAHISALSPAHVVVRDAAFKSPAQRINAEQVLASRSRPARLQAI